MVWVILCTCAAKMQVLILTSFVVELHNINGYKDVPFNCCVDMPHKVRFYHVKEEDKGL